MKKVLLFAAVASVALASCVSEEVTNPAQKSKITFDSPVLYGKVNSRANVFGEIGAHEYGGSTYTYPRTENFQIYAVSHEGDFAGWASATATAFDDTPISYDQNVDGWAPKTQSGGYYYWENGKKMSFAASSPADLAVEGVNRTYGADGLTISGFEVNADPAKQYDLLFSTRSCNNTSANMQHGAGAYSGVPVRFQHALSSIRFSLRNTSNEEVILTGIEIAGVKYRGEFKENLTEGADKALYQRGENVNPAWTADAELVANPYVAFTGSVKFLYEAQYVSQLILGEGNSGAVHNLLLMPQELTDDAIVTVHYTVNGNANTKVVNLKGLNSVKNIDTDQAEYTPINAWEIGKRYTYRLYYSSETAKKDMIYFAPSTEEWEDVDVIVVAL